MYALLTKLDTGYGPSSFFFFYIFMDRNNTVIYWSLSQNVRITFSVIPIEKDRKKIWTSSKVTRVYQYEKNNDIAPQEGRWK